MTSSLFQPLQIGSMTLPNRIIMAPLTRGRALTDGTPTAHMAEYYRMRASAGLIVTEATAISEQGYGWLNAPGMFKNEHQEGWKTITKAVHEAGGRIFMQLWHMGRVTHGDFYDIIPVAPSAIAAPGQTTTLKGKKNFMVPQELRTDEITTIVQDYVNAAKRAIRAGFDGVEIHAANGYLLDQFLRDGTNHRQDAYGGSVEKRARFLKEVIEAVTQVVGRERVGVRLSPRNEHNGISDSNPSATFPYVAEMINAFGIAYVHVLEWLPGHKNAAGGAYITPLLRKLLTSPLIVNGGYNKRMGEEVITQEKAEAVAYGVPFIANPDLVKRFEIGADLNVANYDTFYTPGKEGYLDYPLLKEV